jgi:hypothetical protein
MRADGLKQERTFGTALRSARVAGEVSLRELARRVHYSHSYVSKVETGAKPPTLEFAQVCDRALGLNGNLIRTLERPAPARSAWPRPIQLPPGPMPFVARESEFEQISGALTHPVPVPGTARLVVLDGGPGVGKTALALHWAHQNLDHFPDGVLFANLRGHSEDSPARPPDVLADFCRALGVTGDLSPCQDQRAGLLRSLLAGRQMLLLLDNASSAPQVRPLLPALPGCAVLVTSRRRLVGLSARDGARAVTVKPLDESASARVVGAVIGRRRAEAEPQAVADLAIRCAGLPLALRLAAQRAATQPDRPLRAFTDDMFATPSLLDELTPEDDPGFGIRSAFSWSRRQLDVDAARVFELLGQHCRSDFNECTLATLAGIAPEEAAAAIHQLVAAHLVEPVEDGWYRMPELHWMYAREVAGRPAVSPPPGRRNASTERFRCR